MNIPNLVNCEEIANNTVASVLNKAQWKLGLRQSLHQLAKSAKLPCGLEVKVDVASLKPPLAKNSECLIRDAIEKKWRLTENLMYVLKYLESTTDEAAQHFYFEAIFSQPSIMYPIPQVTVSVFFRLDNLHTEPPEIRGAPNMIFRIEGHLMEHDMRYVKLELDWILAEMKMKLNLFKRIEELHIF